MNIKNRITVLEEKIPEVVIAGFEVIVESEYVDHEKWKLINGYYWSIERPSVSMPQ